MRALTITLASIMIVVIKRGHDNVERAMYPLNDASLQMLQRMREKGTSLSVHPERTVRAFARGITCSATKVWL